MITKTRIALKSDLKQRRYDENKLGWHFCKYRELLYQIKMNGNLNLIQPKDYRWK
jgi:hypothetical protein